MQALPPDEIKDLNRGRAYLANVADRHDVTVYQSLEVALQEAFALVQQRRSERFAQFIADEGCREGTSDSDAGGTERSLADNLQQGKQQPQQQPPSRPSITSALADLASQLGPDGFGVDDAISEDDEEDRGENDEEDDAKQLPESITSIGEHYNAAAASAAH